MDKTLRLILFGFLLIVSLFTGSCKTGFSVGDDTPPAAIGDLGFDPLSRLLGWTAPGDDGNSGRATIYFIRFFDDTEVARILGVDSLEGVSFDVIERAVQDNFDDATQVVNTIEPDGAGAQQSFQAPRLDISGTKRFFYAIRTNDEVGNQSDPSNVVQVETPLSSLEFQSAASGSCLGEAVGSGNFDGDDNGIRDVAIGDPCLGVVYVFFGGNDLVRHATQGTVDVSSADVTIIGNPDDLFGASVAGVGNIDGDFADELAIGAPGFQGERGEVVMIRGSREGLPSTIDLRGGAQPDLLITGENAGDKFGFTVSRRGSTDILIGAPGAQSGRGRAYLFRGGDLESVNSASDARGTIIGQSAGDMFGFDITQAGQIDSDVSSGFAVSSPGAGKVYVFFDRPEGIKDLSVDTSDVVTIQGDPVQGFGSSISGGGNIIGDVNNESGDERDDLLIGAPGSNADTGSVFLYSGVDIAGARTSGLSPDFKTEFTGISPGDRFGTSISVFSDLTPEVEREDRDTAIVLRLDNTNADFGIGSPGTPEGGTAYLFFGRGDFPSSVSAGDADIRISGGSEGLEFGKTVGDLGDVTGDFIEDFAVGGSGFIRMGF